MTYSHTSFTYAAKLFYGVIASFVLLSMPLSLNVHAHGAPDDIAELAARLTPAVVNIATTTTRASNNSQRNIPQNNLRDFFEDFFRQQQRPRKVRSLGSGFVIDPSGLIVTNNHVVANGESNVVADEIVVTFPNGKKYDAKLIGRDPRTDIAVLKIEADEDLPFVKLADSSKTRVGEWVVAIGNPFGLEGSLSVGVVSAINRNINAGPYDSFIQTDAAINRGNSGGPLFSLKGEVIGVNTAIYSPTGGSVGIGFAIPSDLARVVISQLTEYGETRRGWLGVRIQPVDDALAENLGLRRARGALVSGVIEGGPAQKAGIKQGDVIIRFDSRNIEQMHDLPRIVAETSIDKRVRVDIIRRGKPRTIIVKIDRLEDQDFAQNVPDGKQMPNTNDTILGMKLRTLTNAIRNQYNIAADVKGVLIADIDQASEAYDSGLRRGNVLVEIDYKPIQNIAVARKLLNAAIKAKKGSVLLLVQSEQRQHYRALALNP